MRELTFTTVAACQIAHSKVFSEGIKQDVVQEDWLTSYLVGTRRHVGDGGELFGVPDGGHCVLSLLVLEGLGAARQGGIGIHHPVVLGVPVSGRRERGRENWDSDQLLLYT